MFFEEGKHMSNIAAGAKKQPATALASEGTPWIYNDGGRAAAGFKGKTGDCVTRAIAIATKKPYQEVYDAMWASLRGYASSHRDYVARGIQRGEGRRGTTPRNGVSRKVFEPYLKSLGWKFTPTMYIGSGCKVHLRADELPGGRLIVSVSRHLVAVIDGVVHDIRDCSHNGARCVYGFYQPTLVDWPPDGAAS
jgi:hypothetical protein